MPPEQGGRAKLAPKDMNAKEIKRQNLEFLIAETNNVLNWAFARFKERVFMTTAFGADGTILLDFARKVKSDIPVYFINTGYHFPETLEIKEYYRKQGVNIIEISSAVDAQGRLWEEMGPDICCTICKVEPMKKLMEEKKGHLWITALSRVQSETRQNIRFLEPQSNDITKLNAMLVWKEDEVWEYIKKQGLKYNRLFDQGYRSIGCKPCTTPVKQGEDSRAGRWRDTDKKECGLHNR